MNGHHATLTGPPGVDSTLGNKRPGALKVLAEPEVEEDGEAMSPSVGGIHQYKVLHTLGVGRHGEVKKAVHRISGCMVRPPRPSPSIKAHPCDVFDATESSAAVALKLIPLAEGSKKGTWTEIDALKRIRHPHVVRLLDVFTTEKSEALVLECLSGGELFDYLVSRQRLREPEARKFTRQILSALEHCHGLGVIHRDLKLENLLLDSKGNVKITDFGFSNIKPDNRLCSTFVGSPAYAAPEILANEKYAGPAADIWSLGVIIVTILTGAHPFQDPNVAVKFEKVDKAEVDIPDFVSVEAQDLVRAILRRRPSERPTIKQIWAHPWVTADGEGPLVATVAPPDPKLHADVCAQLRKCNVPVETLEKQLAAGEVGGATVDYHLLMEKMIKDREEAQRNAEIAAHASRLAGLVGPDSPFRQKKNKLGKPKRFGFSRPPAPALATPTPNEAQTTETHSPHRMSTTAVTPQVPELNVVDVSLPPKEADTDSLSVTPKDSMTTPVQMRKKREIAVPEGHRLSTDIDTGLQIVTPIRPTSRGIPATSATCHVQRRRSVSGAGTGDAMGSPARRRSSRAGLVSMTQFGDRRRPVAARINSRGALLAMLRDTPLKETPIGISPPSSEDSSAAKSTARRRTESLNISPERQSQIVADLAKLTMVEEDNRPPRLSSAPEAQRRFSHMDVTPPSGMTGALSIDGLDAVVEESSPQLQQRPITSPGLALPFTLDQRALSHGDTDTSLLKPEPMFRKLRSDGGNRLRRASAIPKHEDLSQINGSPDPTAPLDLAVSLPTVPFNAATTSSLPPHRIMTEAMRVLADKGIEFTVVGQYKIACQCRAERPNGTNTASKLRTRSASMKEAPETVGWEMEICMLPKLDMHGIRLHRVSGNIWTYKEKVQEVTAAMKL